MYLKLDTWSNNNNSTLKTQRKIALKHHVWIYHHLLSTTLIPTIQKALLQPQLKNNHY